MKTSYFWKAMHEPISDVKYVSISRSTPPGVQYMLSYESLMPSWDLVKLAHDQDFSQESFEYFRKAYYSQLDKLNPEKVYEDLKDCTLVCFESSKDLATKKKFCHRRMVAGCQVITDLLTKRKLMIASNNSSTLMKYQQQPHNNYTLQKEVLL